MSLRALILDHIWLKLFSLILATLIWLAVWSNLRNEPMFKDELRTFVNRPIGLLVDSPERPPLNVIPEHASVTVRGPGDLLLGLKDEDINVFVRVPPRLPHGTELAVPVHVHVPVGIAVAMVTPITATLRVPAAKPSPALTP